MRRQGFECRGESRAARRRPRAEHGRATRRQPPFQSRPGDALLVGWPRSRRSIPRSRPRPMLETQLNVPLSIDELARRAGIPSEALSPYGRFKAKVDHRLGRRGARAGRALRARHRDHPDAGGGGQDRHDDRPRHGAEPHRPARGEHDPPAVDGAGLRREGRRSGRRREPGRAARGDQPAPDRRLPRGRGGEQPARGGDRYLDPARQPARPRPGARELAARRRHERPRPAPGAHRARRPAERRPARDGLRHHVRVRGDERHRPRALARGHARAARADRRRGEARRDLRDRWRARRRRRDGRDPARRARPDPHADLRGHARARARRAVREHLVRQLFRPRRRRRAARVRLRRHRGRLRRRHGRGEVPEHQVPGERGARRTSRCSWRPSRRSRRTRAASSSRSARRRRRSSCARTSRRSSSARATWRRTSACCARTASRSWSRSTASRATPSASSRAWKRSRSRPARRPARSPSCSRRGSEGGEELARAVAGVAERGLARYQPGYGLDDSIEQKLHALATGVYGASGVELSERARADVRRYEELGYGRLPICMAKTQYSLSHDPKLKGAPSGYAFPDPRSAPPGGRWLPRAARRRHRDHAGPRAQSLLPWDRPRRRRPRHRAVLRLEKKPACRRSALKSRPVPS